MISINRDSNCTSYDGKIGSKEIYDIRCLSTDSKPTAEIPNGSTCIEIDTGKIYMFDADGSQWREI